MSGRNIKAGLGAIVAIALVSLVIYAVRARSATPPPAAAPPAPSASLSPSAAPSGPAACQVSRLAPPPGTWQFGWAFQMSPTGRYVLGAVDERTDDKGKRAQVLWDNGTPRVLTGLPKEGVPIDVNDRGDVLINAEGRYWVWRNGTLTKIATSNEARIIAFNDSGTIVGTISRNQIVIWRGWQAPQETLVTMDNNIFVQGIDNQGNVLAFSGIRTTSDQKLHFFTAEGKHLEVVTPALQGWLTEFASVHDGVATVTHKSLSTPSKFKVTRWNSATQELTTTEVRGVDLVSNRDWIVLQRSLSAALASGTHEVDLLGPVAEGHPSTRAISVDGRVIVGTWHSPGSTRIEAVQWRCS